MVESQVQYIKTSKRRDRADPWQRWRSREEGPYTLPDIQIAPGGTVDASCIFPRVGPQTRPFHTLESDIATGEAWRLRLPSILARVLAARHRLHSLEAKVASQLAHGKPTPFAMEVSALYAMARRYENVTSRESDEEARPWRGVFSFAPQRRALFSQTLEFDLRKLSRWKPQITLTRRILEDDHE